MAIKNLVLEGGGVKGIAYVGALEALERANTLSKLERVAGTSAGAITAMLVAVGYSVDEIKEITWNLNFKKFMDDDWGFIRDTHRLTHYYGWYKGEFFLKYAKDLIKAKTGNENITFRQLHERILAGETQFKDLYTIGVNLTTGMAEKFSYESTHADVPIALAVRISMSIPLFFKAVKLNNDIYVDGGVMQNYPISIFDKYRYLPEHLQAKCGKDKLARFYNPETLGIRLDSKEEISMFLKSNTPERRKIKSLYQYAQALVSTILNLQNLYHMKSPFDIHRSIYCDTLDVSTMDFGLSNSKKRALILSGQKAVAQYFADHILKTTPEGTVEAQQKENHGDVKESSLFMEYSIPESFPSILSQFESQKGKVLNENLESLVRQPDNINIVLQEAYGNVQMTRSF